MALTPPALAPFLPQTPGILPYWLLLTSSASVYNALQNYFVLWQTKEIYSLKSQEGESYPYLCLRLRAASYAHLDNEF
jgi:hypothetical protein